MSFPNIDDFDLLDVIGTGSFSTVHRARNKISKDYFAIKLVKKKNLSKTSTDNLLAEIKLLKTLKHKYIVEMTDFRWDERNIYIIMELCNAGDLSSYIRKHKTLPETTCKFFLRQLALALHYMRSNNVSHFDLKPHNLLLTKTPNITLKVADFGFAQHLCLNQENTIVKGSPLYMAPEILLKQCYDPSADLWSIGVILYECLFGNAPYSSKTMEELLHKIKTKHKIDININSKITHECRDFLTRLLKHEPKDRITFTDFFGHDFLDLHHEPTDENLTKAIEIVTKAVEEDNKQNYEEAFHLYCEGLQYFVPLLSAETDVVKMQQLKERANTYMKRAEEIKNARYALVVQPSSVTNAAAKLPLEPNSTYTKLYALCVSSPKIQSALEIGRQAELYSYENNFKLSVENYKSALSILVPLLSQEPTGHRKILLHQQTMNWMKEAESMKSLTLAQNLKSLTVTSISNCCVQ